jgi:hypothetical protein
MRTISWLHISDLHLSERATWSQDVVLKAMCEEVARQRAEGLAADFILATGDIAFSGKQAEYALAAKFFDDLTAASGVPKERIFCIPGNHDINRDRQKLSFSGARNTLVNQTLVGSVLEGGDDFEALCKRQEAYRVFQRDYFAGQARTPTADGLAYAARLSIDDLRIAIIGLDSAWMAEGGLQDHGKLLVGERQVINATRLVRESGDPPHVTVAMAHHPFHLLHDFDRRIVRDHVERSCQFFHCGHLHEPEEHASGFDAAGCLTLAAGASFETRESVNTYSVVTLDLLAAKRHMQLVRYDPAAGRFSRAERNEYRIEVAPAALCGVEELADVIRSHHGNSVGYPYYLAALLLDQKSEVVIPAQNGYTFGSLGLLQSLPDGELKQKATTFIDFRNALRVLYKRVPLRDILERHGDAIGGYAAILKDLGDENGALRAGLLGKEGEAQKLARAEPPETYSYAVVAMEELAAGHEWTLLREQAQRHANSSNPTVAIQARRLFALALAHSDEPKDKADAVELYRALADGPSPEITDFGSAAVLLNESGKTAEAKAAVMAGMEKFAANNGVDHLREIGQRIVEATGDREFRKQMDAVMRGRGQRV